jgi:hypothetical protein
MAKIIDTVTVTRVRRTAEIRLQYDASGALLQVQAIRVFAAQMGGVDVIPGGSAQSITLDPTSLPATIVNQLTNLAARIDTADTAP